MSAREASEWVHAQTITEETSLVELVAAFTALTGRAPTEADRPEALFRRCGEIVMAQERSATAPAGATTFGRRS
jgi:hypothetical protein